MNVAIKVGRNRVKEKGELKLPDSDITNADIVVAATGKIKITGDMLKSGAVLIDVAIQRDANNKICGDADFESCSKVVDYITPVPGGIGPMTIAGLMMNVVDMVEAEL